MAIDFYSVGKDVANWVKNRKVKRYTISQFYRTVDWFTSNELKIPKLSKKEKDELLRTMESNDPMIHAVNTHGRTYVLVGDLKKRLF